MEGDRGEGRGEGRNRKGIINVAIVAARDNHPSSVIVWYAKQTFPAVVGERERERALLRCLTARNGSRRRSPLLTTSNNPPTSSERQKYSPKEMSPCISRNDCGATLRVRIALLSAQSHISLLRITFFFARHSFLSIYLLLPIHVYLSMRYEKADSLEKRRLLLTNVHANIG